MMKSPQLGKKRSMCVETLEHRAMLAGDVTVAVVHGDLLIAGDAEGNEIAVASGEQPGQVYVAGLPSPSVVGTTTVNGMTGRVLFEGVRHNVMVRMGEGDDVVRFQHLRVAGDLGVGTGGGDDRVMVGMPPDPSQPNAPTGVHVRGAFRIATGLGDDVVIEQQVAVGLGHSVATGQGSDEVLIGAANTSTTPPDRPALAAERAFIDLGDENDVLRVNGAVLRQSIEVAGGRGDDMVRLDHVAADRGIRVSGGAGDDEIGVSHVRTRQLSMNAGVGNDRVSIVDAALGGLRVDMGAGDDGLAIGRTEVRGRAILLGGRGEDTLVRLGGNQFRSIFVSGFEHVRQPSADGSATDGSATDALIDANPPILL